jgi:hypothetical protein
MARMTLVAVLTTLAWVSAAAAETNRWVWWVQDSTSGQAPADSPAPPMPDASATEPTIVSDVGPYSYGPTCCSGWWANYCIQRHHHGLHCGCGVSVMDSSCGKVQAGCAPCARCFHLKHYACSRCTARHLSCDCGGAKAEVPVCTWHRPLLRRCYRGLDVKGCGCSAAEYSEPSAPMMPSETPPRPEPTPADGPST